MAHPHTSQRRKLGRMRDGGVKVCEEQFDALKQLFDFDPEASRHRSQNVKFVGEFDLRQQKFPRLELFRHAAAEALVRPWWVESFWEVGGRGAPGVLKIEAFVSDTTEEASKVFLHLLTEFEIQLPSAPQHEVGDIANTDPTDLTLVFARGRFVFIIRNVGTSIFPVVWVGRLIDEMLIAG